MELMERWNQKKELAVTTSYAMYLNIKSLCAVAKTTDLKGECECVCVCVCVERVQGYVLYLCMLLHINL